jgi:CheY-like chemotaxis protein
MTNYIVVVEDDHLQEAPILEDFEEAFPGAKIETICTESEFRDRLPHFRSDRPDILVIDVMLRWSDPQPNSPRPPQDVAEEGYYRAGLRCAQLVSQDQELRSIPVVLYTILERDEIRREGHPLGDNVFYVRKGVDVDSLIRLVQRLVSRS